MNQTDIIYKPIQVIINELPLVSDFLKTFGLDNFSDKSFLESVEMLTDDHLEINGVTRNELITNFCELINGLKNIQIAKTINNMKVLPGVDKSGIPESCSLSLKPGEIVCIVGPTGSGKSRLLADIEWLANADTPTGRRILINGSIPDEELKNNFGGKLIAQITQNMNYVLDMDVESFLLLHAQSRFLNNAGQKIEEVIELANELSGEGFTGKTPITFLSGGQSRALMIADVACIGKAPIVLIDEIENAGVDKKKALELLINKDKIVLMATHDPLLILQANRRVIINNGGMQKIIETNEMERTFYRTLQEIDSTMQEARTFFRHGYEMKTPNIPQYETDH